MLRITLPRKFLYPDSPESSPATEWGFLGTDGQALGSRIFQTAIGRVSEVRLGSRDPTGRIGSMRSGRRISGLSYLAESRGPEPRRLPGRSGNPRVGSLFDPDGTTRPRTPLVSPNSQGTGEGSRTGTLVKGRPSTQVSRSRKPAGRRTVGSIRGRVPGPETTSLGTRFGLPVGAARERHTIQCFWRIRGRQR